MTNEAKAELRKVWETRVAEFQASGLSAPKWCEQHDLKPNQLRYWLKKFSRKQEPAQVQWLPLDLSEPAAIAIRVEKAVIEVQPDFDPELLLRVVRTLSRQ